MAVWLLVLLHQQEASLPPDAAHIPVTNAHTQTSQITLRGGLLGHQPPFREATWGCRALPFRSIISKDLGISGCGDG